METCGFQMCAGCSNKQIIGYENDGHKKYHCSFVDGVVKDGIVYDDTDASACVRDLLYR